MGIGVSSGRRGNRVGQPVDQRTPYAWLGATAETSTSLIDIYQSDSFGLSFVPFTDHRLPDTATGSKRPRREVALVRGRIEQVDVVFDTDSEEQVGTGMVTEVFMRTTADSTLLIAAEAYSRDEWHLHDESVVALRDPAVADSLRWVLPRARWRQGLIQDFPEPAELRRLQPRTTATARQGNQVGARPRRSPQLRSSTGSGTCGHPPSGSAAAR